MPLVPGPDPVSTGVLSAAATIGSKLLGDFFGGGKPNIAKRLSRQVGFTVLQRDAATVRQRIASGLDPRTGQPKDRRALAPTPPVAKPPAAPPTDSPFGFDTIFKQLSQTFPTLKSVQPIATAIAPAIDRKFLDKQPIPVFGPGGPPGPIPPVQGFKIQPGGNNMSLSVGMSGLPTAVRGIGAMSRGVLRTATGRISGVVLGSGQRFSRKNAAALIRKVGLEAASVALGIGIIEAAEILLAESQKRRRGGGITAAQVRNARSTACKVARLARDLNVKPAPARRRTCR